MTISLSTVAASTTPTVIKTFFRHYKTQLGKSREDRKTEATDEFFFHEAFSVVKRFIGVATTDTVEALQAFTNTYIPATHSTSTRSVVIPLSCCNAAAKLLIEYFGPKDLEKIVGGRKWWQVRGLNGVEAEWIFSRKDRQRFKECESERREGLTDTEQHATDDPQKTDSEEHNRLERCMLALHGGAFYMGSINTHRQMFARFARKFGGRVFAVNYRKSPQYPWPCPLQDALAGYLYLIEPPPEARHKPVDPKNIVVCGDSAGGGLSLALLAVLRDLGKPMPAGAVLISPWCDMTHSFPSILQNTETDIIPQYGFIHKPSTLWPVPDELNDDESNLEQRDEASKNVSQSVDEGGQGEVNNRKSDFVAGVSGSAGTESKETGKDTKGHGFDPLSHLQSEPIGVTIEKKGGERDTIELNRQVQLYATNSQIFHPLCSPVLQGSLGGLPPLYILAGNAEVLRDEIIYLAHRAARPQQYQLRNDLLEANERAREDAQKFNGQPTKVHLQVYDGQPHVLTLFSFTTSARYAYRAIASFIKHVTGAPTEIINPFPDLGGRLTEHSGVSGVSEVSSEPPVHVMEGELSSHEEMDQNSAQSPAPFTEEPQSMAERSNPSTRSGSKILSPSGSSASSTRRSRQGSKVSISGMTTIKTTEDPSQSGSIIVDSPVDKDVARQRKRQVIKLGSQNDYNGQVPLRRPTFVQEMIRERVDIRGKIRPLEDEVHLQALQMPVKEVGMLKAGPVQRYLSGQTLWDEKYQRTARRVAKQRAANEKRVDQMLEQASHAGLLTEEFMYSAHGENAVQFESSDWSDLSRLGPLGLAGERPPPSAIAGRRDTSEAVELYRQALHMQARHLHVDTSTAAKATLGNANPDLISKSRIKRRDIYGGDPWKQSTAERQIQGGRARYGLKAWGGTLNFLNRRKTKETQRRRLSNSSAGVKNSQSKDDASGQHARSLQDRDGDWVDEPSTDATSPSSPRQTESQTPRLPAAASASA